MEDANRGALRNPTSLDFYMEMDFISIIYVNLPQVFSIPYHIYP